MAAWLMRRQYPLLALSVRCPQDGMRIRVCHVFVCIHWHSMEWTDMWICQCSAYFKPTCSCCEYKDRWEQTSQQNCLGTDIPKRLNSIFGIYRWLNSIFGIYRCLKNIMRPSWFTEPHKSKPPTTQYLEWISEWRKPVYHSINIMD